jgi:hypothetical protein
MQARIGRALVPMRMTNRTVGGSSHEHATVLTPDTIRSFFLLNAWADRRAAMILTPAESGRPTAEEMAQAEE